MEVNPRPGWERVHDTLYVNWEYKVVILEKEESRWFVYMLEPDSVVTDVLIRLPDKPFAFKPFRKAEAAMAWGTGWARSLLPEDR